MIPVTRTYLPPIDDYLALLSQIWESGHITNNGRFNRQLQQELRSYLGAPNLELVANGMLALQLAIKALAVKGEVITTPFSYVATTTAILWEGCEPVFVDIEEGTFCIDADQVESAITEHTSAILATHVYGYPCDVEKIEQIARKYDLKVIYDAAHAFAVRFKGRSLLCHGDVSAMSFHATKLFHCAEGGAVICRDENIATRIGLMKKFGHIGEEEYLEVGVNAKMSELHAAMGLCVLPKVKEIIANRRVLSEHYDSRLDGLGLKRPLVPSDLDYNYGYYAVVFPSPKAMTRVRLSLISQGIIPRRYFYPSLNKLPYLRPSRKSQCPVSESIASRVLCLPLYFGLELQQIERISKIVSEETG